MDQDYQGPPVPPPERFKQWEDDILNERDNVDHVLDCAWRDGFRAGADQELERQALSAAADGPAVPEGVELPDKEIEEWADASAEVPLEALDPDFGGWQRCFNSKEFCQMVRAVLARWGNAMPPIESES